MKVIVVSGAHSGIGKTTLVREIAALLTDRCITVKIGHGNEKPNRNERFFHAGTTFADVCSTLPEVPFCIIESNSILRELTPEMVLYIDGKDPKPSAHLAKSKADIINGTFVSNETIGMLSDKLCLNRDVVKKIVWLTGAHPEKTCGILLAGGRSLRMGTDKSLLKIGETTLAERIVTTIAPLCDEVIISTREGQKTPLTGYRVVTDLSPDKGPLMGIYSALEASVCDVNIVVSCDIPTLYQSFICTMLSFTNEYDIVIPSFAPGTVEPLLGIYRKKCAVSIRALLDQNILRVSELFKQCSTKVVTVDSAHWYANVNTPQEFATYVKEHPDAQ